MGDLVSIILPCYNAEKFISLALESIISQTHKNLQVICINDGSTDRTGEILEAFQKRDSRVEVYHNEKNIGLIATLNEILTYVKGDYFARMDNDDFSHPKRIEKQLEYLVNNPELDVISLGYIYFKEDPYKGINRKAIALRPGALKFLSIFVCALTHPGVFGRSELIRSKKIYYDPEHIHAEDYELFSRLCWNNVKLGNISEILYSLRDHESRISIKFSEQQDKTNLGILTRNLRDYLHLDTTPEDHILKLIVIRNLNSKTAKDLTTAIDLITECKKKYFETEPLTGEEKSEIDNYLDIHIVNMFVQLNKAQWKKNSFSTPIFFISSVLCLNGSQLRVFIRKIFRL